MLPKPYGGPERRIGDRRRSARVPASFTALGVVERRQQGRRFSDRTHALRREQLLDIARTFLRDEDTR